MREDRTRRELHGADFAKNRRHALEHTGLRKDGFVWRGLWQSHFPQKTGEEQPASELGRKLRKIAEKTAASGERRLSRRELEREIAQRRGGIR